MQIMRAFTFMPTTPQIRRLQKIENIRAMKLNNVHAYKSVKEEKSVQRIQQMIFKELVIGSDI